MSEFVDLYDRNRKLLNRVVDRSTYVFQPGEFMMYVLAILENEEGKFLVTQRALDKKWAAGGWEMPGGGAKSEESSLDAIKREVKEETGLDVKNITYFGNQPWPYPSGLMVGFIADYAGGEITLQDEELSSGDFYTRDHLPELPRKLSLARKMIDWWLDCSNK